MTTYVWLSYKWAVSIVEYEMLVILGFVFQTHKYLLFSLENKNA